MWGARAITWFIYVTCRGRSRLVVRGVSVSLVVMGHSTYEPGGGGGDTRDKFCSSYIRVNINRLIILQSLH